MNEDRDALQGLWTLESVRSKGQPVGSSVTHWEFAEDRLKKIVPSYVDGGPWLTFTLDTSTAPRHLDTTYTDTDGATGEITTRTYNYAYELDGDTLRVGGPMGDGQYPALITDWVAMVTVLRRYDGPRPETKQASGTPPVENPVLGTVTWDDDTDEWVAAVAFTPEQIVRVTINVGDSELGEAIATGEALVTWAKEHEAEVRAYAAQKLLDMAEEWRDEDEDPDPITPEAFAERITLEALSVAGDGSASFWYDDDAIFAGHVVVVYLSANRECTDALIMG